MGHANIPNTQAGLEANGKKEVSGKSRKSVATAEAGLWDVLESHLVCGQCRYLVSSFLSPPLPWLNSLDKRNFMEELALAHS